jgi:hypothetical protein
MFHQQPLQDNSAANKAQAAASAGLNSVAFDPNFQNPDGTQGANVVMNSADAGAKGLQFYKTDPNKINAVVAGMNDVQTKLNQLAAVTTDPSRMKQVQPRVAADMLRHGHGIELGAFGRKIDPSTLMRTWRKLIPRCQIKQRGITSQRCWEHMKR